MKLPNGNEARLEQIIYKLETYSLNTTHKKGKHKARVFRSKLGITLENKDVLADALMDAAAIGEAKLKQIDIYGEQYTVDFFLTTSAGSSAIRSRWIIRIDESYPRLVSVYPT